MTLADPAALSKPVLDVNATGEQVRQNTDAALGDQTPELLVAGLICGDRGRYAVVTLADRQAHWGLAERKPCLARRTMPIERHRATDKAMQRDAKNLARS